jgi:hypothetical protein
MLWEVANHDLFLMREFNEAFEVHEIFERIELI